MKMTPLFKLHSYLHEGDIISGKLELLETRKQILRKLMTHSESYLGKLKADKGQPNPTDEALLPLLD
jgi:hypothetical protein